jgi:cytochrome c oxidase subunit 2
MQGDSILDPHSSAGDQIASAWWLMLVVATVIFAVVLALIVLGLLRRRGQDEPQPASRGRKFVVWLGVVMPAIVLLGLFLLTLRALPETAATAGGKPDLVIGVKGHQYFWDVTYPGAHPFRTANEIYIPVGEPVRLDVTTDDVLHSLWIPELNRKIDMIPGRTNQLDIETDDPGIYEGRCAEFCGLGHAWMGITVTALPRDEFDRWVDTQQQLGRPPRTAAGKRGQQVFMGSGCVYCHTIAGTPASGRIGPDLTHLASRSTLGARVIPNLPGYLAGWIVDPQHYKPGNRMPGTEMNGTDLRDLIRYLEGLK